MISIRGPIELGRPRLVRHDTSPATSPFSEPQLLINLNLRYAVILPDLCYGLDMSSGQAQDNPHHVQKGCSIPALYRLRYGVNRAWHLDYTTALDEPCSDNYLGNLLPQSSIHRLNNPLAYSLAPWALSIQ